MGKLLDSICHRPLNRYRRTQRVLNAIILIAVFLFGLTFVAAITGCASKLDKAATLANYENVRKISVENDAFIEATDYPESLKLSAQIRNEEARDLAREMALATGNKVPTDGE